MLLGMVFSPSVLASEKIPNNKVISCENKAVFKIFYFSSVPPKKYLGYVLQYYEYNRTTKTYRGYYL